MTFQFHALSPEPFAALFALDDDALHARGTRRVRATAPVGFPCRVSLADAEPGDSLVLVHHLHHDVPTPFRASGPVYVREGAVQARPTPGEVPAFLRVRVVSLRGYDAGGMMQQADVVDGGGIDAALAGLFANAAVAYVDVHSAKPGCFLCRATRA